MNDTPLRSGIAIDDLRLDIRPQDDLYHHVNQAWMDRTEIPSDKSRYGTFDILHDAAEQAVRKIIEESQSAPTGSEARKFGDLYASFMDEGRVNELGVAPMLSELERVKSVAGFVELLELIGRFQRQGIGGLHQVFVDNDPGNPERYLTFFEQGGLSLPDESYYREEHFDDVRAAFVEHLQRMFELAGLDASPERARRVFELETEIARRHWDNVRSRDSVKTYNPMSWSAATALFTVPGDAGASLGTWLGGLGAPAEAFNEVVLRQPSFTGSLGELFVDARLAAWKDWLLWQVIAGNAPFLSSDFVDEHFDFFGRTLTGAKVLRERWKRGVALVEGAMGEAVGRIYVERNYPPVVKDRMDVLVQNLIDAYGHSIAALEWMGEATRQRALEKLANFTPKVGYPVRWRDYSGLEIDPADLLANVHAATEFEFSRTVNKVGQPVDRDEWFMTPQTINAYYNPGFNEIVFPAAILQPPFFDVERDEAANYGAIGAIIGHEIGHGFDDQGSKFDGTGRLIDWWEASDRAAFEERTRALVEQFNVLAPVEAPDLHVNGELTIGENIGDLGGLAIAWQAYLLSLGGAEPPVIDGLSASQRFFLSWAQGWRNLARREEVERLLAIDPHSPDQFRGNQIPRNVEAFYDAFGVGPGDSMWIEPSARVTIW